MSASPAGQYPVASLHSEVIAAAREVSGGSAHLERATLERPPQPEFGDFSTNAGMLLAPSLEVPPKDAASRLGLSLKDRLGDDLERFEVAGPGFLNLFLGDGWYERALAGVVETGDRFGGSVADRSERVNIEFVSANPTGPLHVGHGRHAAYGDALARTLSFAGHEVIREFYVNDYGSQITRFGESIAARIRQARGEDAKLPEDGYAGEYVVDVAAELADVDADDVKELTRRGVEIMLDRIKATLTRFRVSFDAWSSERELQEAQTVERVLDELDRSEQTYESEGALWLCTTRFGDDKDRVLRRSTGELTYFAADIAYHEQKAQQPYDHLIDVFGADHHGYLGRMKAAFEALGEDPKRLEIVVMQLVNVLERGERAQMSKRKGEFEALDDLIEDIGTDAARFFLLQRSHDTTIDLDLELAREQSQNNPVYYVQYAHARIASILRNADAKLKERALGSDLKVSQGLHQSEKALIGSLIELPELVATVVRGRSPHRLTTYVTDLAAAFHVFYRDCRVIGAETSEVEEFRLALCVATKAVLQRSLNLLGVEAPERM